MSLSPFCVSRVISNLASQLMTTKQFDVSKFQYFFFNANDKLITLVIAKACPTLCTVVNFHKYYAFCGLQIYCALLYWVRFEICVKTAPCKNWPLETRLGWFTSLSQGGMTPDHMIITWRELGLGIALWWWNILWNEQLKPEYQLLCTDPHVSKIGGCKNNRTYRCWLLQFYIKIQGPH